MRFVKLFDDYTLGTAIVLFHMVIADRRQASLTR
jgi:hypothetical protein